MATPVLGLTEAQREYYELARAFAHKELAPEKVGVCVSGLYVYARGMGIVPPWLCQAYMCMQGG